MSQNASPVVDTQEPLIDRRACLARGAAVLGLAALAGDEMRRPALARTAADAAAIRNFLRKFLYKPSDIDAWLAGKAYPFCKYDPELGYLHINRDFKEGVDGAICSYRYDQWDARQTIAHADKPCRINTYGNSFTSCEQVSDGETWQEYLAAHLGEPIRNFGIGGYSVYQAYLRMKREEQRVPAKYLIVNIFDHDHYRNLLGWQRFCFGINDKSPCPPVPHLHFDREKMAFVERKNPCSAPALLYELCDASQANRLFDITTDDSMEVYMRREERREKEGKDLPGNIDFDDAGYTHRALNATTWVVDKIEEFAARENKKVLYVLSYAADRIRRFVKTGTRFDQALVDFLERRKLPYVDLLAAHIAESKLFVGDLGAYLDRYFIGHYAPAGNFFCADALRKPLAALLDPPPPAYR